MAKNNHSSALALDGASTALSRPLIVIDACLKYVEHALDAIDGLLNEDHTQGRSTNMMLEVWNLVDVTRGEMKRAREANPKDYDSFMEVFTNVGSLCTCMAALYDIPDYSSSRFLKHLAESISTIMAIVELEAPD